MRYGQIRKYDVANGPGIRTSIFVTGCTHNCPNCFNPEYQDFNYGNIWTQEETDLVVAYLSLPEVAGLTLLGGEPFQNTKELTEIVRKIKERVAKPIWAYSGYTLEELEEKPHIQQLLDLVDVLVDGRFEEEKKDLKLPFKGSSNQRIIDMNASRKQGKVVIIG